MGEEEEDDVYGILGCREDHPRIARFLHSVGGGSIGPTSKESFGALGSRPACVYHNFQGLGLSLCFEASLLFALHLYNATHGYATFQGRLPHGLRMQMRGADIVRLLGEPDGKLGGGRGGPISLAYKDKGLQLNLMGNDWEDKDNMLDSITIHEPL